MAFTLIDSRRHGFEGVRRSYRKPAPGQTAVQVAGSGGEIMDVSYGGVRLKLQSPVPVGRPDEEPPVSFDIVFPLLDLCLYAAPVWTSPDGNTGGWLCGADISRNDSHHLQRWRDFVDSVS